MKALRYCRVRICIRFDSFNCSSCPLGFSSDDKIPYEETEGQEPRGLEISLHQLCSASVKVLK